MPSVIFNNKFNKLFSFVSLEYNSFSQSSKIKIICLLCSSLTKFNNFNKSAYVKLFNKLKSKNI